LQDSQYTDASVSDLNDRAGGPRHSIDGFWQKHEEQRQANPTHDSEGEEAEIAGMVQAFTTHTTELTDTSAVTGMDDDDDDESTIYNPDAKA